MDCKIILIEDGQRSFCAAHGVYLDRTMTEISGAQCPLGYITDVERRFKHEADEVKAALRSFGLSLEDLRERLEKIEG